MIGMQWSLTPHTFVSENRVVRYTDRTQVIYCSVYRWHHRSKGHFLRKFTVLDSIGRAKWYRALFGSLTEARWTGKIMVRNFASKCNRNYFANQSFVLLCCNILPKRTTGSLILEIVCRFFWWTGCLTTSFLQCWYYWQLHGFNPTSV